MAFLVLDLKNTFDFGDSYLSPSFVTYHCPRNPNSLKIGECSNIRGELQEAFKLLLLKSTDSFLGP
jgi:hypothetical protein